MLDLLNILLNQIQEHFAESVVMFKPELAILITFILSLFADVLFKTKKNASAITVLVGMVVTGVLLYFQSGMKETAFMNMIAIDPFAVYFKYMILISSFGVCLMSLFYNELYVGGRKVGEYYSLIAGMTFGMFLLAGATNLIMVYLAIEMMSFSSYILAGYTKEIKRSSEASLKYVIYGSVSSGIMVYGMSILFGASGTLHFAEIANLLSLGQIDTAPLIISGLMILVGFGYKVSLVPFHFWTPDVYEGAPVTITAFLSVASKIAGFAGLIRFATVMYAQPGVIDWQLLLALLSFVTMTVGNLSAIWQSNVKRILAFSAIAHAGYILMALVAMDQIGISSVMFYLFTYIFMNLGAFMVVMLISNRIQSEHIDDYNGIGYKMPVLGALFVIFLVSLAGIPPTAGFLGKFYVFAAILDKGDQWLWLAIAGVINSAISVFYYFKIFRNMYLRGKDTEGVEKFRFCPASVALTVIFAIPTLLMLLYYSPILDWANASAQMLLK